MTSREEISKAHVTIEGNIKPLKEAVQDANKEVEKVGEAADNAGSKVDQSFAKAGDRIEQSTTGVRKFVGALSSVAGVATGVLGVIGLLSGAFLGLFEILKRLNGNEEGSIGKTTKNLQGMFDEVSGADVASKTFPVFEKLQDDIEETAERVNLLRQRLIDYREGATPIQDFFKIEDTLRDLPELEAKLEGLLEQRENLLRITRDLNEAEVSTFGDEAVARFQKLKESADSYLANLRAQSESIRVSLIGDDEQRIKAETDLLLEQLDRVRQGLGISADNADLQAYIDLIRAGEAEKLSALETRIAKERQADQEREAERDRRSQERAQREIQIITDGLNSLTNSDLITTLEAIPQALRGINNNIGRLPR